MGLIDAPGRVRAERLAFAGRDLHAMGERERRALLGGEIAMIFQDPTSSLNPSFTVAFQLMETIALHEGGSRKARRERARCSCCSRSRSPTPSTASTPSRTSSPAA